MLGADVVVIGGGMAGMSVAFELADDVQVVVLEAETQLGVHSTGRSAAVLTTTTGPAVVRELAAASRAFLTSPPDGFTSVPLAGIRGVLRIAGANGADALERSARDWPGTKAVSLREASLLVPRLRPEVVVLAVWEPGGLDIDVDALLQGYRRGLLQRGGRVVTGARVHALERTPLGWRVSTAGDEIECSVVVDAAGAWADEIARLASLPAADLIALRRTAFVVDAPDDAGVRDWPLLMDLPESFYVKPDGGLLLGSPADETPSEPCDARPEELDVAIGIDRMCAALDVEVRTVRRAWAGLRTFAPNREPLFGPHADDPTFIWCAGQGGYGIKIAPALARRTAALALTAARGR